MQQQHGQQHAAAGAAAQQGDGPPSGGYREEVQAGFRVLRELFAAMDAGHEVDFECVRGKPGVVMEPMPWQRLVSLIGDGSERALGSLGRHPLGIKAYWDHRDRVLLAQYASVPDYLLLDIFGFKTSRAPDGRCAAVVPPGFFRSGAQAQQDGGGDCSSGGFQLVTKWRENDFPYHLEPGIAHLNLWANRPLSAEEVEAHIAEQVPAACDITWFVNPPAVQSVPSIWHAHVLYRRRQGAGECGSAPTAAAAAGGHGGQ